MGWLQADYRLIKPPRRQGRQVYYCICTAKTQRARRAIIVRFCGLCVSAVNNRNPGVLGVLAVWSLMAQEHRISGIIRNTPPTGPVVPRLCLCAGLLS